MTRALPSMKKPLVKMPADLYISKEGEGWKDVLNGFFDADGQLPCKIDGGLKCFGHLIGASGLRMI